LINPADTIGVCQMELPQLKC
jgi:hypothetical protein